MIPSTSKLLNVVGWRANNYREPPDNREIENWEYYLAGQNLVATVTGIGSTWNARAAPPSGQRNSQVMVLVLHGTDVEGAKYEVECILRDLGHVLPASDPPVLEVAKKAKTESTQCVSMALT